MSRVKLKISLILGLTGVLIMSDISHANYTFLGKVEKYQFGKSGIRLYCQDRYQLNIEFLTPNMLRVFLLRPMYQEAPLDYPLAKTDWPAVELDFSETEERFIVRSAELELQIQKSPCRLKILDLQGHVLNEDDPGFGIGWDGKEIRNWKTIAPDEKFFGLGEKAGPLNKRGRQWVLWNTDNPHHDNNSDELYQAIPFYVGLRDGRAYGIYFNNSYRSKFNFGAGNQRYAFFSAEAGNLDYFFIFGPQVARVVQTYTELTGRTPMPPKWALGYQQCRWSYFPQGEIIRLAETFREKQIPADVIYLDIHYMDGYRVFTWDKNRFPDPQGMIQTLREMGFKVVVIIDPGVKVDEKYRIAQEGLEGGHFVKYPDGELYVGEVWPGEAYFPDFSRAETRQWWGRQFGDFLDTGVKGFWNDMNEPAVWGQAFPEEVIFDDQGRFSSQKKLHNLYGFLMAKACSDGVRQLRPDERVLVITRAGFAGEQRFTAVWTGDNHATEDHLEMGIRMMQGLGVSGIPFVGTDVGGFQGTPTHELFVRWIQTGLYSPFFRTHSHFGSTDQEPWSFGEVVEKIVKECIRQRYAILPYLYSLFYEAHRTGAPLLRPLFWHHQDDENVHSNDFQEQFLVGRHLLVAPVTRDGHRLRKVYLPEGDWLDLNTETVYAGKQTIIVEAPLEQVPKFLHAGGILPSREPEQYVDEQPLDRLFLDVFPGEKASSFEHYEDDGVSYAYESDSYRLTEFTVEREKSGVFFGKKRLHDRFEPGDRQLVLRIHAVPKKPKSVHLDGKKLPESTAEDVPGFTYDATRRVVTVRFPDIGASQAVRIE